MPSPPLQTGLRARVHLHDLAAGGEAVGRLADGRIVFVPGGAPEEEVEVSLDELRKGYVRGTLRRVLSPSPDRVSPVCSLAAPGRCGGCPIMHVSRIAQLSAKQSWVTRAVRHSGAVVLPILAPTPEQHYRIRAKLGVMTGSGGAKLSFAISRSGERQPIAACPVLDEKLSSVLFVKATRLTSLIGSGGSVSALVGQHEGQPRVQLAVELGRSAHRPQVIAELQRLIDEGTLCGAILGSDVLGAASVDIGGELGPLAASADGFAQASEPGHSLLPKLVQAAVAAGHGTPPSVLELYAGSGNLTRALLGLGGTVLAVEGEPRAAARLRELAHSPRAEQRLTVRPVAVERALPEILRDGPRCDTIVLDPPRGGARPIVPMLGALSARRIVYVSCDAMTLGRDLGELQHFGFTPRTVQPLDLMPHTAEVECVAVLDR